jgi:hypothetical protein
MTCESAEMMLAKYCIAARGSPFRPDELGYSAQATSMTPHLPLLVAFSMPGRLYRRRVCRPIPLWG